MTPGIDRDKVVESVHTNIQDRNMLRHILAVEAIMRSLARRLGEDEEEWGLTGLAHDIDIELVKDDMSSHGRLAADIARELGASESMVHAILCHNEAQGVPLESRLDWALYCADPLSGLITAAALVRPDRLSGLTTKSVMKRFREKSFAAGVNREQLAECRQIGLELEEFVGLGIEAMQGIASDLEL